MNKRTIVSMSIGIMVLLVSVTVITYAYFASQVTNSAQIDIETEFDVARVTFTSTGAPDLSLSLTNADLMQVGADTMAKSAEGTITISLLSGTTHAATCTYNLKWNWVSASAPNIYVKTTNGGAAYAGKEFAYYGLLNNVSTITETQVPVYNAESLSTNIYSGTITNSSATTPTTQTWKIGARFYNLAIPQDTVVNGTYNANVTVGDVVCTSA